MTRRGLPVRHIARFGPPLAWMGVIAVLSGGLFGSHETGSRLLPVLAHLFPWAGPGTLHGLHAALRKMGHLVEYGVLGALWLRALAPGRPAPRAAAWAIGLAALYAAIDEVRQGLAPNRSPAALDVGIDTAGAVLAVAALQAPGPPAGTVVRVARWATLGAAVGSLAAAVVDWTLGLRAWDLVLAALGAGAAAYGLGRARPSRDRAP